MYSKAYSDRRYAVGADGESVSLPPRYGGVRFSKTARSDGRENVFGRNLVPMAKMPGEAEASKTEASEVINEAEEQGSAPLVNEASDVCADAVEKRKNPLSEILKNVGEDDILIIALILIIAAEKGESSREAIFLLAVLLCFR